MSDSATSTKSKSLVWSDSVGNTYSYLPRPLTQACLFILCQEMCERLAFYGLTPNLQNFLLGENGAPRFFSTTAEANQYLQLFNGILYITPILSAIIADTYLGVFKTILIFSAVYFAGLCLVTASAETHAAWMLHLGMMVLMTIGAGGIKSCVNVFGAHQFHPEEQKAGITSFFTYFYAAINIGGLIGGIACPPVQQDVSWTLGFAIPTFMFVIATVVFVAGYRRYVVMKPQGSAVLKIVLATGSAVKRRSFEKCKKSQGGTYDDNFIEDSKAILRLAPLFTLILPFIIAYGQMVTTFLTQGKKMDSMVFGWNMPAAQMQNVDCFAVIVGAVLIDMLVYKPLQRRNMMPSILQRFAIGCMLGVVAMAAALVVEKVVMSSAPNTVPIWWQVPQFSFIALGEIFLISTSYEMAFSHAPDSLKAFASAINLAFMAIANFIATALTGMTASWQTDYQLTYTDDNGNVVDTSQEEREKMISDAHYDYYFILLAALCLVGAAASLLSNSYYLKVKAIADKRKAEFEAQKALKLRDSPMSEGELEEAQTRTSDSAAATATSNQQ